MKALTLASMFVATAVAVATAWQAPATELKEGDVAPNFSLVGSDGTRRARRPGAGPRDRAQGGGSLWIGAP